MKEEDTMKTKIKANYEHCPEKESGLGSQGNSRRERYPRIFSLVLDGQF